MTNSAFNKISLQRAFNTQFYNFVDHVESLFTENNDIKKASIALYGIKKVNPKIIIFIWNTHVVDKYADKLYKNDIEYFLNKDYSVDIKNHSKNTEILKAIDNIRIPLRDLETVNKNNILNYLKQLCKLCTLYFITK